MIEIVEILEVKNYLTDIKAVIFDLDDTLYSEKEYIRSGYKKVAAVIPQVENAEKKLWELFEQRRPAIDDLLKQEGISSESLKQECLNAYRYQIPDIRFYDGVKELMIGLRERGFKLGVITDGRPEGQRAKIEVLGIEQLVDHIIITDELGGVEFRKPNPTAFRLMKEKLETAYEEMCYVGDNIKKDFISPEQLGMKSIWFKNKEGIYTGIA